MQKAIENAEKILIVSGEGEGPGIVEVFEGRRTLRAIKVAGGVYNMRSIPMSTTTNLYAPAQRHFARLELADRQRYEAWLLSQGVRQVAEQLAAERGLSGMAATYFADGFAGRSAAFVNPRKDGMEAVFREGRRARAEKGVAQRIRAAAANMRAQDEYSMDAWLEIEYQFRPVPWRSAFGG